ncbi:MAG: T9SS type A sorting domain-containing protein [Bacteroidales bacterium]|nr:T9SS type A sorting domain-containing protein [Bacteroidales bacterium]
MNRIICTIGKTFLLLVLLAATSVSKAQHCDSIPNHLAGHYCLWPIDAIQLADGNILIECSQDSLTTNDANQERIPYLVKYYKISRYGAAIIDSIVVENPNFVVQGYLEQLHTVDNKYGNLMINRIISDSIYLNIKFFDDDLNFNDEMEVTFPIPEEISYAFLCILDSNDDIILTYRNYSESETCFARFGLDGTLKHTKAYPDSIMPITDPLGYVRFDGLRQNGNNPLGYDYYGANVRNSNMKEGTVWGYELDSLFNIRHSFELNDSLSGYPYYYYTINPYSDLMISQGDGTAYFSRNIGWQPTRWGTVIQKVNEYSEVIDEVQFQPCPRPNNQVKGINMEKDRDDNICYSFFGLDMDSCHYVATVKVDPDLNILWERYAMRMQAPYQEFMCEPTTMKVFGDDAVLVFGQTYAINWDFNNQSNPNNQPWLRGLFLTLMYDGVENVAEMENAFRPYLAYPNPVHDQIYLHYSPDVQPKALELYDMQGRLIRKHEDNFEHFDTESLVAGQYVLKVVFHDGTTYSEKIIKK